MNKKTTVILISFFLCVSIVNVSLAQEQISGRIIEINRDLDVVFINKGKEFLNIGDIVKIYDGGQFISYLKVVQILEKVAALSSFQDAKVGSEMISFEEITVGNTFVKADKEDYEKKEKHKSKEGMKPSFFQEVPGTEKQEDKTGYEEKTKTREIEENNFRLSKHLNKIISKNKVLEEERDEVIKKIKDIKKDMDDLKNENLFLKSNLEKNSLIARQEIGKLIKEKDKYLDQIEQLSKKLSVLKNKLNKMANLIDRM